MYVGQTTTPVSGEQRDDWLAMPAAEGLDHSDAVSGRFVAIFPNVLLSVLPNHAFVIRLVPGGPGRTTEECTWLVPPGTDLDTAMRLMDDCVIRHLPVVEKDELIGVISDRRMQGPHPFHMVGEKYLQAVADAGYRLVPRPAPGSADTEDTEAAERQAESADDDVVAAVERSEERYLELTDVFVAEEVGLAFALVPLVFAGIVTTVDDLDAAVFAKAVVGRDVGQTALETVVEAGDFIPGAEIAVQIEAGDDVHAVGSTGACGKEDGQRRQQGGGSCSIFLDHYSGHLDFVSRAKL